MTQYRAQFQTMDGRTHAVIDVEPITARRLAQVDLLLRYGVELVDHSLPSLVDLTVTPTEWLEAAERVLGASA